MSIKDFLDEHRIPYKDSASHKNVRQGWIGIDCPHCGEGTGKYHLGINIDEGFANCWQCGPQSIFKILANLTGLSFKVIRDKLGSFGSGMGKSGREGGLHGRLQVPKGLTDIGSLETKYLLQRGFSADNIRKLWGVQATSRLGILQFRLWIPVYHHGILETWTTRSIGSESAAKYVHAKPEQERTPIKHLLYGEDYARHSIVITEGVLDAWAIGPGAVALFGLNYTSQQIKKMSKYPIRAICLDNEKQAKRKARELYKELSCFPGETTLLELETGNDPADCEPSEIEEIRKHFCKEV